MISKQNVVKTYAMILALTSILGSKILSINIGVQLSLIRILLIFSPLMFALSAKDGQVLKGRPIYRYYRLLCFWVIYSLLLFVFTPDKQAFSRYFFFLFTGLIVTYFVGKYFVSIKDYIFFFKCSEILSLLFAGIGVYEIFTGDYHFIEEGSNAGNYYDLMSAMESTIGIRIPMSVFGNPNDFAIFLLFSFFISYALSHIKKRRIGRFVSQLAMLLFVLMIISTQSRSSFISLLIGSAILIVDFYKRQRFAKRVFICFFVLCSFGLVVNFIVANKEVFETLVTIDISSNSSNESDIVRVNLIKNGLSIWLHSGMLGVGLGNIEYYMRTSGVLYTNNVENIHNWWFEILVSSGLIVFVWYVKIFLQKIRLFTRLTLMKINNKNDKYYLAVIGMAIMFAFILSSMGSSSLFPIEWLWAYMAVLYSLPIIFED